MKRVTKKLCVVIAVAMLFSVFSVNNASAASKKYSLNTMKDGVNFFYNQNAKIIKDNRGYYFAYKNNGYFEKYLGTNSTMTIQNFASKLDGRSDSKVKFVTVTQTESKLKKWTIAAIISLLANNIPGKTATVICTSVASYELGAYVESKLRQPGEYKIEWENCYFRRRDGALKGCGCNWELAVPTMSRISKYNNSTKKYEVLIYDDNVYYHYATDYGI